MALRQRADAGDAVSRAALLPEPTSKAGSVQKASAPRAGSGDTVAMPAISLFVSLTGDDTGGLDLDIFNDAMTAFRGRWKNEKLLDDYAFQSALRWYAAMHFYLGGAAFQKNLASELSVAEGSVSRWINGLTAPLPKLRIKAMAGAENVLQRLVEIRHSGGQLADIAAQE